MSEKLTIHENGTVFDNGTKLTWQRSVPAGEFNLKEAKDYAERLQLGGFTDWRVPTRTELISILNLSKPSPAIDTDAFPDTPNAWFWSVSPRALFSKRMWIVNFYYGDSYSFGVNDRYRVRCVR